MSWLRDTARWILVLCLFMLGCFGRGDRADTLVYLAGQDIQGLDPHTSGFLWQTHNTLGNIYEGLISFDASQALEPGLALSWSNADEYTWEFELRGGVPFHCGGTFSAQDAAFSLERARNHPRSVLRSFLANIKKVEVRSGNRIRVYTHHPDGFLLPKLRNVFMVSQAFVERNPNGAFENAGCGTGPYRLTGWVRGKVIDLERFDTYWRGQPSIPNARILPNSFGDNVSSYLTRTSRAVFYLRPTSPLFKDAVSRATPVTSRSLSIVFLAFDLRQDSFDLRSRAGSGGNPFLNPRVREAISRAIDYAKLRKVLGLSENAAASQFVPAQVFGFNPSIPAPRFSTEEARAIMARELGTPLEVDFAVRESMNSFSIPLTGDLEKAGIRVHTTVVSDEEFPPRNLYQERPSIQLIRFSCRTGDAQEFLERWLHSKVSETGYGRNNFAYDTLPVPGLDAAIEAAGLEMAPQLRQQKLQDAMRVAVQNFVALPLVNDEETVFLPPGVTWPQRADNLKLFFEARFE